MKRKTLDILFSIGGLAIAALFLVAGSCSRQTRASPTTT